MHVFWQNHESWWGMYMMWWVMKHVSQPYFFIIFNKKIFATPLHFHQTKLLTQEQVGRQAHVGDDRIWNYHLHIAAEVEINYEPVPFRPRLLLTDKLLTVNSPKPVEFALKYSQKVICSTYMLNPWHFDYFPRIIYRNLPQTFSNYLKIL